ncbi:ABC transporter substrate-binding protein [Breznakiella homolactica]|uniref:ABC transporter substrate-binding protein n=1 Tax=Breznakiella homolactica TaxID=2798577 RepID=A0A7T8B9X1_9SPIR|nr:ABC transporter substrate-binding protein [Breznakiella homolactica]QQO08375.1 ABC transporter substrate-binding protein [Breznakiella homolactica]
MNKKSVLVFCLAILLVPFAFAGGGKEDASAGGTVSIELWSSLSGSKATLFDEQVARFNASQQDVRVAVVHQGGYSILRQKVAAAANSSNMPALLIVDYLDVAWYAQLNLLKSLDGLLPASLVQDFYPAMLSDLKFQGKLYAVPYNRSTQGFFVNMDVLRQAGITKPAQTWTEFRTQAEQFKKLGRDYYYGYAFFHQFLFDAIAYSWGAQISTPDGTVLLNSPEMVEMMTYFQRMYKEGLLLMQPVLVGGFEEQNGAFLDGKVASVFQTSSFIPTVQNLLKSESSFEFIPAGKGGHAITMGGGNFAVTAAASQAQTAAAVKFLEYMSSPDIVAEFFMGTGNLPVRQSVSSRQDIRDFMQQNPLYVKMVDQLQYGKAAPSTTKNIRDVFNRVNDMISRIILNNEDVKKVLDEYTRQFQEEIDEAKANGEFIF